MTAETRLAIQAAVVPVGKSPDALPIGVQVAGRPFQEEIVLGIAEAIDAEFGFIAPPLSANSKSVQRD